MKISLSLSFFAQNCIYFELRGSNKNMDFVAF